LPVSGMITLGLTRARAFPGQGLLAGDRLAPTATRPYIVATLTDLRVGAAGDTPLVFWRRIAEPVARRRNPLFALPGTTAITTTIDILHNVYLGIAQRWSVWATWRLVHYNTWRDPTSLGVESRLRPSACRV